MLKEWIDAQHGVGEEHQYQFYRCRGCGRLMNWKRIRAGGCDCRRAFPPRSIAPTRLSLVDKFCVLVLPWTV